MREDLRRALETQESERVQAEQRAGELLRLQADAQLMLQAEQSDAIQNLRSFSQEQLRLHIEQIRVALESGANALPNPDRAMVKKLREERRAAAKRQFEMGQQIDELRLKETSMNSTVEDYKAMLAKQETSAA
eukprot:COSAG06_NODE_10637_length_1644_cov_1.430421_1_plen_133_part_00